MSTPATPPSTPIDRGAVIARSVKLSTVWAIRFLVLVAAAAVLLWLIAQAWVAVFPLIMAMLVTSVLWPATRFLRRNGWPSVLAAASTLLIALAAVIGIFSWIAPSVIEQGGQVVDAAGAGLGELQKWTAGPPLNLDNSQLQDFGDQLRTALEGRASDIAAGVFTGVAAVGNVVVTTFLVLVLTFFFLKDGTRLLPFLHRWSGRYAGQHLVEVSQRVWNTVSGFIRTQALVGLIDATLIGSGLLIAGVPLAFALAVLTFFGAFIPVVGAFVAGGFAVLVALVSNGFGTAIFVFVLVLAVQQIEGNLLLPILQSKSMDLHPGIVLVAIVAGSTLFGIVGAFLAVPVVASVAVMLKYYSEQIDIVAGKMAAQDVEAESTEGMAAARREERRGVALRGQIRQEAVRETGPDVATSPTPKRGSGVLRPLLVALRRRLPGRN
ncbi:MAG: AI-2E family transporter [Ornithinimicrobium sp.]